MACIEYMMSMAYVTRYEKRDRSGYFIIFAFLVSFDSYACVRSNGAN